MKFPVFITLASFNQNHASESTIGWAEMIDAGILLFRYVCHEVFFNIFYSYIYIYWYSGAFLQHQKRHRKKGSGYKIPTFSALRKTHQLRDLLENTESSESSPSPLDLRRTDCAPTSSAVCGVVARASNLKLKGSKRFHNVAMNGEVLEPSRP